MNMVERRRLFAGTMTICVGLCATALARAEQPASTAQPAASSTAQPAAAPPPAGSGAASSSPVPGGDSDSAAASAGPVKRAHRGHSDESYPSAINPIANKVRWDESWPKFRPIEYIATGVMGVAVFAARAIPPQPNNWRGVTDFDAKARSAVRLESLSARNTADDASDLILTLMVNQLIVDATLVAWWGHDRFTVGYQMVLIDLEALALTGSIQALVSSLVSRWRPFRDTCVGPIEKQTQDCQDNKQYTSFWSGHTSGAFTVAGLTCMHHAYLPLYGGGVREALTCATAFAAAATVGYLRMAADQHFLTDVLVGASIGTLSGLGVPWLLHYRGGAKPVKSGRAKQANQVSLRAAPTPMGMVVSGEF
jgi:membrane-associated phospholipid phosphatase